MVVVVGGCMYFFCRDLDCNFNTSSISTMVRGKGGCFAKKNSHRGLSHTEITTPWCRV